ncbi:MAG: stage 0 sporulation protein, partial [Armatimonadetes bacterium]|nr:stage 0 sporulation protein [Armatimonadota bacterium]
MLEEQKIFEKIKAQGIVFAKAGKVYYISSGESEFKPGEWVVVETIRGLDLGKIATPVLLLDKNKLSDNLKSILRKAAQEDFETSIKHKISAKFAFQTAKTKIKEQKLPIKLIDAEYTLDGNKIIFYFSAEGRIDFRALAKNLAAILKKRIEFYQIGVRDETKLLGGLGPCGRTFCCASFLSSFGGVSITMAKVQNLALNPSKISGCCGRLMFCLAYENEVYKDIKSKLPPLGTKVILEAGEGEIVGYNIPKGKLIIELESKVKT